MSNHSDKLYIRNVNEAVSEFCRDPEVVKLMAEFPFGYNLRDASTEKAVLSTVVSRIVDKFEVPDRSNAKALSVECHEEWLSFESSFVPEQYWTYPFETRAAFQRARLLLKKWCKPYHGGFESEYQIEITPGETFVSARGRVSVYEKLRKVSSYTVYRESAPDAIHLLYNTLWMRNCVMQLSLPGGSSVLALYNHYVDRYIQLDSDDPCYDAFTKVCAQHLFTYVEGERGSSVYKNSTKRRFIGIGAFLNVLLQRNIALKLRRMSGLVGNDLTTGQEDHKGLIKFPELSTIDLKNGSDSNWLFWLNLLWPSHVVADLLRHRAPKVRLDLRNSKEIWVKPRKLSAMGNGYTFEVMTLTLLALSRAFGFSRVYGDDVIVPTQNVPGFLDVLRLTGWIVNQKKTFIDSHLRESCGGFYCDNYGYITCYDVKWSLNRIDANITVNKINEITAMLSIPFGPLKRLAERLAIVVPRTARGPDVVSSTVFVNDAYSNVFGGYVTTSSSSQLRNSERDPINNMLRSHHKRLIHLIAMCYQIPDHAIKLRRIHVYGEVDSRRLGSDDVDVFTAASYFYAGRRSRSLLRVGKEERPIKQRTISNIYGQVDWLGSFRSKQLRQSLAIGCKAQRLPTNIEMRDSILCVGAGDVCSLRLAMNRLYFKSSRFGI